MIGWTQFKINLLTIFIVFLSLSYGVMTDTTTTDPPLSASIIAILFIGSILSLVIQCGGCIIIVWLFMRTIHNIARPERSTRKPKVIHIYTAPQPVNTITTTTAAVAVPQSPQPMYQPLKSQSPTPVQTPQVSVIKPLEKSSANRNDSKDNEELTVRSN
ncbi:uncharacterized protein LOC128952736 [Oppia nitens]|uniref:uncharacterized protein LOC128952736 n=1 Tax=Oppia nitens TaxID=1686743 RepID=UPI0023DA9DFE|nr:uncharacterized protein LOC128952736 [Oppia nitens]